MQKTRQSIRSDLGVLLICVATLILVGLIFIYSSSSVYALERLGSAHYFVKRQLIGLLLGLIGLIIVRKTPLRLIKQWSPAFFFGSLILTAMTMIPFFAQRIHGSSRWLNLGGLVFQPSELLRITFLIYLAYFLAKKEKSTGSLAHSYLPFLIILGVTSVLLLKQPDFGMTVTLAMTGFILLFIAQFKTKHLLITLSALLPVGIALVGLKPYRLQRILTFLNPWSDPLGSGFQIIQSLIAIGSGGLTGLGISHSKQKFFYLPMLHTDFIFSIIAEETGFIGAFALITIFCIFLYFGLRLAWRLTDPFSMFTTLGFVIVTSLQAIINLAVTTGLVPTKGIGLPFVSYGNTSLICNLCMLGLIINIVSTEQRN